MTTPSLEQVRFDFAEELRALAGLKTVALVRAFATVPREDFVGPGPWQIAAQPDVTDYQLTPDADPRHLYRNVLVALDPARRLNNGEPSSLAFWLDQLALGAGCQFFHIGCGVGYYTAIAAEAVSPGGSVVAAEIDPDLAERARANLRRWRNVELIAGSGTTYRGERFDAIFLNAGATEVPPFYLDLLRPGGRLLLPLTIGMPGMNAGLGQMLLVTECNHAYGARFISPVGIYHCAGARTEEGEERLRKANEQGAGDDVRSLRRDPHGAGPACWLHAPDLCLSRADPLDALPA